MELHLSLMIIMMMMKCQFHWWSFTDDNQEFIYFILVCICLLSFRESFRSNSRDIDRPLRTDRM